MPCKQCLGIEAQFNDKVAKRELTKFQKTGAKPQTRMALDELRRIGISGRTLLDIGGGVGAIQHACAEEGAAQITSVDASAAYLAAAVQEARRRGYASVTTYLHGDFVELAPEIPPADLVTMDRVVCCYPDLVELLRPAAERARVCLGLVFPRDNWWMRAGARVANLLLRLGRSEFQAFIHPHAKIDQCAAEAGLELSYSEYRGLWRVALFVRA